ncbi:MAG TPA: hypothetical protein VK509_10960 [Polyangiales bacterium]|nr:hypothetical protein [Polyangiales bacterium]
MVPEARVLVRRNRRRALERFARLLDVEIRDHDPRALLEKAQRAGASNIDLVLTTR